MGCLPPCPPKLFDIRVEFSSENSTSAMSSGTARMQPSWLKSKGSKEPCAAVVLASTATHSFNIIASDGLRGIWRTAGEHGAG